MIWQLILLAIGWITIVFMLATVLLTIWMDVAGWWEKTESGRCRQRVKMIERESERAFIEIREVGHATRRAMLEEANRRQLLR